MYVVMAVTNDKYELPIAVADTANELGRMLGIKGSSIRTALYKVETGVLKSSSYKKVYIDDEE